MLKYIFPFSIEHAKFTGSITAISCAKKTDSIMEVVAVICELMLTARDVQFHAKGGRK